MFSKWIVYAVFAAIYTAGVVHVTSTYTNSRWTSKELKRTEQIIKIEQENKQLLGSTVGSLKADIKALDDRAKKQSKELLNEMAKDERFSTCRTTDGVRNHYKNKLQSQ